MRFEELERRLTSGMARGLPGPAAHVLLAPRPRRRWTPGEIPSDARLGAALLLLYPVVHAPTLLLTVRNADLPLHAGQVSLPGGAVETGETVERAALREAKEETGVEPGGLEIVGRLTPLHVPVSGFALHPVVGLTRSRPDLRPHAGEVERVLEAPLSHLEDPAAYSVEEHRREGTTYQVPIIRLDGEKVWGATAMILAELLVVVGSPPPLWRDA